MKEPEGVEKLENIEDVEYYIEVFKREYQSVIEFDDPEYTNEERIKRAHWRTRKIYFYKMAREHAASTGKTLEQALQEIYGPNVAPPPRQGTREFAETGELVKDEAYFKTLKKIYHDLMETDPERPPERTMDMARDMVRSHHFLEIQLDKAHSGEKTLHQALKDYREFTSKKNIN